MAQPTLPPPPLPQPSAETQPFWDACRGGELQLQRCGRCGHFWFPPAPQCPECWSRDYQWERVSGRGTVFSFVVYHRVYHPSFRDQVPYTVAVVHLAEGVRFMTRLIDVRPADVRVGMAVEVAFTPLTDEITLPLFRPAQADAA